MLPERAHTARTLGAIFFLLQIIGSNDLRQTEEVEEGGRNLLDKRRGPETVFKPF